MEISNVATPAILPPIKAPVTIEDEVSGAAIVGSPAMVILQNTSIM